MPNRDLAYVALASREPAALAAILGTQLGLARAEAATGHGDTVPMFRVGRSALAVFHADHPFLGTGTRPGVHHIGMAAADLGSGKAEIERAGVTISGSDQPALGGGRRLRLEKSNLAGVDTWLVPPLSLAAGGGPQVERIDH